DVQDVRNLIEERLRIRRKHLAAHPPEVLVAVNEARRDFAPLDDEVRTAALEREARALASVLGKAADFGW
ncbi:MAG TPA: hypothetical protein VLC09_21180, partial [Polyangiaceae bacterium]|nr:hypothetical protein [Polyangiaceae bacterium]